MNNKQFSQPRVSRAEENLTISTRLIAQGLRLIVFSKTTTISDSAANYVDMVCH
jgi:hypothetical protein